FADQWQLIMYSTPPPHFAVFGWNRIGESCSSRSFNPRFGLEEGFKPPPLSQMTNTRRIISLDLGSQTIGLAEFQVQPQGGLVLQNFRLREVLIDPAGDGIRRTQTSATVREMMAELQIRHEAV